jgi:hypothetical protein
MTKKARKILFLICFCLFILIAPSVVFYSQGYRFDINPPAGGKKITQTGGLFLKIVPKQVEVFIDEKLEKRTDFFFGSILIENLLPRKYKIEVRKEGYHSWEKSLEIKEKEVAEVKSIVLFPENPDFTILSREVKSFWFSPDQEKIILSEMSSPTGGEESWSLKLYDLEKNVKSHLIDEKDISKTGVNLFDLNFLPDSNKILLEVGMKEQIKYFTLELDKISPVLIEEEPPSPPVENVTAYQKFNNDIYYLDNSGYLFKNEERITEAAFKILPETEYELNIFPENIFLREGKALYLLNVDLKTSEKFFEPIKSIKISPDLNKLLYFSDYEAWILFLKDYDPSTVHRAGDRVFLVRLSEKIGDCFWLNSDYLIYNAADKIKIAEIDDRDRINIINIAEFKNPEIFWNQFNKKLYILSEGNLYQSENLSP